MADPKAAQLTQLKNIQTKTGQSIQALHDALAKTGLAKVGEKRSWLMETFKLGYGDANAVALLIGKIPAELTGLSPIATDHAAFGGDVLDTIYSGAKVHLRPLHEAVMSRVKDFGAFDESPKKNYISLRRKKQFAMIGPATKDAIEIGFNAKDLPADPRLKVLPAGGMCQATTRISAPEEIDADLVAWLQQAYDSAG